MSGIDTLFEKFYANIYKERSEEAENAYLQTMSIRERVMHRLQKAKLEAIPEKVNETTSQFYCNICLEIKQATDGISLKDCSHEFCK